MDRKTTYKLRTDWVTYNGTRKTLKGHEQWILINENGLTVIGDIPFYISVPFHLCYRGLGISV